MELWIAAEPGAQRGSEQARAVALAIGGERALEALAVAEFDQRHADLGAEQAAEPRWAQAAVPGQLRQVVAALVAADRRHRAFHRGMHRRPGWDVLTGAES